MDTTVSTTPPTTPSPFILAEAQLVSPNLDFIDSVYSTIIRATMPSLSSPVHATASSHYAFFVIHYFIPFFTLFCPFGLLGYGAIYLFRASGDNTIFCIYMPSSSILSSPLDVLLGSYHCIYNLLSFPHCSNCGLFLALV